MRKYWLVSICIFVLLYFFVSTESELSKLFVYVVAGWQLGTWVQSFANWLTN